MPPPIQCKYCGEKVSLKKSPYCSDECRELSDQFSEEAREKKKKKYTWVDALSDFVCYFLPK